MTTPTERERGVLVHMLGLGAHLLPHNRGRRNGYHTIEGTLDHKCLQEMQARGWVEEWKPTIFHATRTGAALVANPAEMQRIFGTDA